MSAQPKTTPKEKTNIQVRLKSAPDVRTTINEYMSHHHCDEPKAVRGIVREYLRLKDMEKTFSDIIAEDQNRKNDEWKALPECVWRSRIPKGYKCRNKKVRKIIDTEELDVKTCKEICTQHRLLEQTQIQTVEKDNPKPIIEMSASQLEALRLKAETAKSNAQKAEALFQKQQSELAQKQRCAKGHTRPVKNQCVRCPARFDCMHPFKVPTVAEILSKASE